MAAFAQFASCQVPEYAVTFRGLLDFPGIKAASIVEFSGIRKEK